MDFEMNCLLNDGKFSNNPHQNLLFKWFLKEISTNRDSDLAKLKVAIAGGKKKSILFIPISTKVQTSARGLDDKNGVKRRKAINVNSNVATLNNDCMDMAIEDGVLSPSQYQ